MKSNDIIFYVGAALVVFGLIKPDISNLVPSISISSNKVSVVDLEKPTDPNLLAPCGEVIKALKSGDSSRTVDGNRLSSLYNDIASLISLDGDLLVIKNTEGIREANRLAGNMLKLDMKGKYSNLQQACNNVVIKTIGDDNVVLSPELRAKSAAAFKALAWACAEGAK